MQFINAHATIAVKVYGLGKSVITFLYICQFFFYHEPRIMRCFDFDLYSLALNANEKQVVE
jgi:hypothetical protein